MSVSTIGVTQGAIRELQSNNVEANNAGYIVQVTYFMITSITYTSYFPIIYQTNNETYHYINK